MKIIHSVIELREFLARQARITFVPTMGNLHQGHLALMRQARQHGACVVASVFVNPLQFGPNEDFERYPRTLQADCELMQGLVDVVFAPSVSEMYPLPQSVFIEPPAIANELCGAARPGHFRGMATVVLKLLNIVQPHVALFGKKDYQQLHIIRQMVAQLNLAVQIVGGETVRAADGLALSSRNQYLDEVQRRIAPQLRQVLLNLRDDLLQGEQNFSQLSAHAIQQLSAQGWQVEYVSLRKQADLSVMNALVNDGVIVAAAKLGSTRLLDNIEVCQVQ
ncbi:MAG: pantoate--beta-alanine ligase [Sideroxydans sp.]|nr:pantoate--beta-alanine ligase [Sideroxydans sp.]